MEWEFDCRHRHRPRFQQTLRCLPFTKYQKPHLQIGNKIVMPPSSLDRIISSQIVESPLCFKIESLISDKISHCGVLEFDAEEGYVYMPEWMMNNLKVREGAFVILSNAALPRGAYVKLRPHTMSFMELTDPKEETMRDFACLSRGDTVMVRHSFRDFYLDVLEVGPGDAVSLVGTDCRLDFEEAMVEKVDWGEKEEEGNWGLRLDEEALMMGGRHRAVVEGKKTKKEGGKEFKPFTGRSHVLGGL